MRMRSRNILMIKDQCSFEEYTIDIIIHSISAVEDMKSCPRQLFTTMWVNNSRDVTFQLDFEATCNLLSLKEFSRVLDNPEDLYLKKTSPTLKMYNGSAMYPLGKCTLRCTKNEISKDIAFFIVERMSSHC